MTNELERAEAAVKKAQEKLDLALDLLEDARKAERGGVWRPKDGEKYWTLNMNGAVSVSIYSIPAVDDQRIEHGNCFPTREAAERHAEKLRVIQELRELAGGFVPSGGEDWDEIVYCEDDGEWSYATFAASRTAFILPRFKPGDAQAAIDHMGDRLNVLLEG